MVQIFALGKDYQQVHLNNEPEQEIICIDAQKCVDSGLGVWSWEGQWRANLGSAADWPYS